MSNVIQEAVTFSTGVNFQPVQRKLRLPETDSGTTIYLLSSSYEYDIHMIKATPPPKLKYKHVLIPRKVIDKLGPKIFRFFKAESEIIEKTQYLYNQKIQPALIPMKAPYKSQYDENLYIPMSEFIKQVDSHFNLLPMQYIKDNIFDIFKWTFNFFNPKAARRIIIIDTARFRLNKALSPADYQSGLINALLTAFIFQSEDKIPSIPITLLFRNEIADYKFDLSKFNKTSITRMKEMLKRIGTVSAVEADESSDFDTDKPPSEEIDPIDREISNITDKVKSLSTIETPDDLKRFEASEKASTDITSTIQAVAAKLGKTDEDMQNNAPPADTQNQAAITKVRAQMTAKTTGQQLSLNPNTFKTLDAQMTAGGNNPVENQLLRDAAKTIAQTEVEPIDTSDTLNTTTSARELEIRQQIGQIKLGNSDFKTITSISDMPLPIRTTPRRLTTTNPGAMKGTGFSKIGQAYEKNLLQRDIVATFMNLSSLPDGFYVTDVQLTDVSTSLSLMDNWRVTLKNKVSGKSNVINIRVPKMKNSRFYMDGMWWNIGKQDFPIPILKVSNNDVMITSNYNKMSVTRYETRSLVTISALIKILGGLEVNPYVTTGSSIKANTGFVSTIEYDEFAKRWFSFKTKEGFELYFNRVFCMKQYSFVTIQSNEFCCGMNNKVPIIINTETGLTRDGKTLTDIMVSILPQDLQDKYRKFKPGKLSMYTEVKVMGIKIPVGLAIAAWEGLKKLFAKANVQAKYVPRNFDDSSYFTIPFKDRIIAIPNTIPNQLLFNGFYTINTRAYNVADFEIPIMNQESVFVDIFNNNNIFRDFPQLTTFVTNYQFFVDAITKDVCNHYNLPDDIVGMLIYATKLLSDNNFTGENHAPLYRVRSSEIIPAIIHDRLAHAISNYNNKTGSKHKSTTFTFDVNAVINELRTIPTVNPVSTLNPMIELHSQETISKKGFHGVNNDRTYTLDKRTYDNSMVGKMALTSSNDSNVGINRQLTAAPKITSLRGYTANKAMDDKFDDLELASFSELITPGTVSRDDSIRTAIACSQTGHIIATADSAPVLISNGIDEVIPAHLSEDFSVLAEKDGKVIEMNEQYMIVQYKDGEKQAINIGLKSGFNVGGGFYVNNQLKANFELNESFQKNDILAYHPGHFTKDSTGMIRLNIGPMMNVAFTGIYSTYEDAGLVTTKASKRLMSELIMKQDTKISATDHIEKVVRVGDEIEIGDPLIIFGLGDSGDKSIDKLLTAFGSRAADMLAASKRIIKSQYAGTVVDIKMYTIRNMDSLSPSLFTILNTHFNENIEKRKILDKHDKSDSPYKLNTLYTLPTQPLKTPSIKGITTDVLIEIFISHKDEASVGDKLAIFGASKQILSEVVPEGLEPYAESNPNEEISLFVAPSSILKRMIPSMVINASGNKVLCALKDEVQKIWTS